jgi:hypothetical protein
MPLARAASLENNEDVAAATMMGLGMAHGHDPDTREAGDSARDA